MCGIVTMIARTTSGFFHQDTLILESLLVMDGQFRGLDSTGAFQVQRNRQLFGVKIASNPYDLFRTDAWPEFTRRMTQSSRIIVGHNRKATQGAVNSDNAHPFNEGKISLVHNGTLSGSHKHLADVDVDSHAICHALAEAEEPDEVLKNLKGAFALVWWDAQKNTLQAIRNTERPLFLVTTRSYHVLLSEAWMAQGLFARQNIQIESTRMLEAGDLYAFDDDGNYTTRKIELKEPTVYNTYTNNGGTRNQGNVTHRGHTTRTCSTTDCGIGEQEEEEIFEGRFPVNKTASRSLVPSIITANFSEVRKHFPVGELTMVKFTQFSRQNDGQYKLSGSTTEPGKPRVDVLGFLPKELNPNEVMPYMSDLTLARVSAQHSTVCGPTITVNNIQMDTVFPTHSPGGIGSVEWSWVVDNCKCDVCQKKLDAEEHTFTSVKRLSLGKDARYRVVCPDCVGNSLKETNKELYNAFEQRRLDAMEDRESVSRQPSGEIIDLPWRDSSATLH